MIKGYELLFDKAMSLGIELGNKEIKLFADYLDMLLKWNQKINLTAITNKEEIIIKHFIDSLTVLLCTKISDRCNIIDVGTGAGFPGVPIKIVKPQICLTLLDSLNKRTNFLNELLKKLNLQANVVHSRAEQAALNNNFRENFDIVTSRAVASLPVLCEYCLPFVKLNGCFVSLKGPNVYNEVEASKNAVSLLGGEILDIKKFDIGLNLTRYAVVIKKVKKTNDKYPRKSVKISKNPL